MLTLSHIKSEGMKLLLQWSGQSCTSNGSYNMGRMSANKTALCSRWGGSTDVQVCSDRIADAEPGGEGSKELTGWTSAPHMHLRAGSAVCLSAPTFLAL